MSRDLADRPVGSCIKWIEGCDEPRLRFGSRCREHYNEYQRERYRLAREQEAKEAEEWAFQMEMDRLDIMYGPRPTD